LPVILPGRTTTSGESVLSLPDGCDSPLLITHPVPRRLDPSKILIMLNLERSRERSDKYLVNNQDSHSQRVCRILTTNCPHVGVSGSCPETVEAAGRAELQRSEEGELEALDLDSARRPIEPTPPNAETYRNASAPRALIRTGNLCRTRIIVSRGRWDLWANVRLL